MKDAQGHGSDGRGAHAQGTTATPQLQRRHFEAIAADLKSKGAGADEVKAMADKLATTNPGFRRDYFTAAATGGKYTNKGPGKNAAAVAKTAAKFTGNSNPNGNTGRAGGWGGSGPPSANKVLGDKLTRMGFFGKG